VRCAAGHAVPADAPEQLCPLCLLGLAAPSAPAKVGPFTLFELLGEGGFGRVYRARRATGGGIVALKVLRGPEFADPSVVAQFREEPTLSSKLDPRYVVQVLEAGEQGGVPYFAMEYMPGKTLRERSHEYRSSPERAAALMIEIAEAVQYLHRDPRRPDREPILHRDLKPENILFHADGHPRISDFGIAKLARGKTWTVGQRAVGCPAYVAPEQVYPSRSRELTAAADVYALGAILYELFTGRPPFDGSEEEILAQLKSDEPVAPRRLAPNLDRFLETVVLNALEKDPARRYRSAAAFAQDLARALRQEPPQEAPQVGAARRVRDWVVRRPLTLAAGAWAVSLALVVGISARSTLAARHEALERDQQTNATVAGMQAVAVNLQLRAYKQRIAELAQQPEVVELLDSVAATGFSPLLKEQLAPFDTMFVMGTEARQHGRTSLKPAEYLARSFEFRDYFQGARRLGLASCGNKEARRAYLARAYTSESDGHFEFAISAPLCREGQWVGVIAGSVATDRVLGAVRVLDDRKARIAAVIGPRDRERKDASRPLPSDLTFIVHPGLARGETRQLLEPAPTDLRAALGLSASVSASNPGKLRYAAPYRVDQYRDPIPGFEGDWSAFFASADESGFVVAVQSRRDVTPVSQILLQRLALPTGIPFALTLFGLAAVALARRRP
jgi:hypothetical protein